MATVVDILTALAGGDWEVATEAAPAATAQWPESRLGEALAHYLTDRPAPGVYDEPSAFEAFIDNGGNVELYRRTIQQLSVIHGDVAPDAVLDIGCGDGRVTAGVLTASTKRVDLVEPSAELLARAITALDSRGIDVAAHQIGVKEFFAGLDDSTTWDVVQSTFALHTTTPAERPALFRSLARHTSRLVIVEFDVPSFVDRSPEHIAYLADRYEQGVSEYRNQPEVIAKFLMPVLVGQLDKDRARYTFEQPIEQWVRLARDAGFAVSTHPIMHYWWADAVMISATLPPKR